MLYFITGVKDSAIPQRRTTAIFLAEALMEEIRSKKWDENTGVITFDSTCSNATFPITTEEATRNLYDDVDDFHGLNTPITDSQGTSKSSDYPNYTQQATIIYVNPPPASLDADAGARTCYKRIEVRIIDATSNETTTLVSLMTSY